MAIFRYDEVRPRSMHGSFVLAPWYSTRIATGVLPLPSSLTIFAAQYLVFIDALCAAIVLLVLLRLRSRSQQVRWLVTGVLILVLAYIFAKIGASIYNDPRPFTQDHVKPLISHARDNGFPSDHALLAAALVAVVGILELWVAIPFVVLAFLVDWARVGAGIHHVADVIGSTLFVIAATVISLVIGPPIARWIQEKVPELSDETTASTPSAARPEAGP